MDMLRELYQETILDHNRAPRNFQHRPLNVNREAHGVNPLCGDELSLYLTVEDGVIKDIGFDGHVCAISTASASLLTEALKGKSSAEAEKLFGQMHDMLTSESNDSSADAKAVGKLRVLAGVRAYPMRVKCATLAWHTLMAALKQTENTISTE